MKTIQQRILPRVRSNSASSSRSLYTASPLSFFDSSSQPPPTSTRLAIEARGGVAPHSPTQPSSAPPFPLALTSPHPTSSFSYTPTPGQSPFFPYPPLFTTSHYCSVSPTPASQTQFQKRPRHRFQLDVGAYGIPKRIVAHPRKSALRNNLLFYDKSGDDANLSVQVGEDAYFINNHAMGVADGVGGWARVRHGGISPPRCTSSSPSPSALFARRLMHYCSEEADASLAVTCLPPKPTPTSSLLINPWPWDSEQSDLQEDLQDSLKELEEGLDILMVLEKAYEKTLKAHVRPPTPPPGPANSHPPPTISSFFSSSPSVSSSVTPPNSVPLLAGSSTALFAILDHSPRRPVDTTASPESLESPPRTACDAVIKIAHIGDCMGMLVRGEEIVWRSEEMWWGFNTPVQLGPSSAAQPQDAHVFSLPVQADDILILASDGLSDNLWDEDVLDEVIRFRRSFLGSKVDSGERGAKSASERLLRRRTLAGMLSEALCSRARRVSERAGRPALVDAQVADIEDEVPFARRAREQGRSFRGGKNDDISVLVAVISPAADIATN